MLSFGRRQVKPRDNCIALDEVQNRTKYKFTVVNGDRKYKTSSKYIKSPFNPVPIQVTKRITVWLTYIYFKRARFLKKKTR